MWIGPDPDADRPLVLGKYRLVAELGHGGMGDVYLASAKGPGGFNTLVVLKRLRNFEDPQHRAMFLDEARLARRLFHPNIVQTYEVGQEEGHHFIVMEYLAGPTLQALRRAAGLVPAAMEIEILCNVLEGLHYAHELKTPDGRPLHLVHRDLCAENVIVTGSGEVKILDFGVAKIVDSISLTQSGFTKGKLRNMPREQLLGQNVDRRADIFAAGVMLWEGLSGRPLWGDMGDAGIASRLTDGDLPSLPELGPNLPAELRDICARALSMDPEARFPDALAFRDVLMAYMNSSRLSVNKTEVAAFVEPLFVKERERIDRMVVSQSTAARSRSPDSGGGGYRAAEPGATYGRAPEGGGGAYGRAPEGGGAYGRPPEGGGSSYNRPPEAGGGAYNRPPESGNAPAPGATASLGSQSSSRNAWSPPAPPGATGWNAAAGAGGAAWNAPASPGGAAWTPPASPAGAAWTPSSTPGGSWSPPAAPAPTAWTPSSPVTAPTRISNLGTSQPQGSSRRWIIVVSLLVVGLGVGGLEFARRGFRIPERSLPPTVQATPPPPIAPSAATTTTPPPPPEAEPDIPRPRERARAVRPTQRLLTAPAKVRRPVAVVRRKPAAPPERRDQDQPATWTESRPARQNPPLDRENPYGALPVVPPPRPRTIDRDAPWSAPAKK